jgi:hypothetical protein
MVGISPPDRFRGSRASVCSLDYHEITPSWCGGGAGEIRTGSTDKTLIRRDEASAVPSFLNAAAP